MKSKTAGFTLIELIITVTVLAVLMSIAIPSFSTYTANQRIRSASENLVSALNLARSEAVKRGAVIEVNPVTSSAWADGWRVQVKSSAVVLADYAAVDGITITASSTTTPEYNRDGRLSSSALNFTVASSNGSATSACVRVTPSGKATINRTGACS